jgi:hypothetical protein
MIELFKGMMQAPKVNLIPLDCYLCLWLFGMDLVILPRPAGSVKPVVALIWLVRPTWGCRNLGLCPFLLFLLTKCVSEVHYYIYWVVNRDARVMWDQRSGRSRGFGFVSFRSQQVGQVFFLNFLMNSQKYYWFCSPVSLALWLRHLLVQGVS